jgi:hypothetical protein
VIINDPAVKAEVEAVFARYNQAIIDNDVETLNALFFDDPRTLRYGIGENLYGHAEIAGFRAARSPVGLMRRLERSVVTTFGHDFATASTLFRRPGASGKIGRQMQTWVRMPQGWKIVAAHVSLIDEPVAKEGP